MNIVIFGGSGFIGSHVADSFTEAGHDVTIYDINKSKYLKDNQKMIIGNIFDKEKVFDTILFKDVVIDLAGISDLEDCKEDIIKTVQCNVLSTVILLEACINAQKKLNKKIRFIFASSAYVFSNTGEIYKCTKQSSELFIQTYKKLYDLNYTIIRYGSVYGTRADERNTIHRLIKDALTKKEIVYKGTGEERREYINVKDAADLTLEITKENYANTHVLFTGISSIKSRELNNMISEMLDNKIKIKYLNKNNDTHYKTTPYSFNPVLGKKLINDHYIDLGLGILEIMRELNETN